MKTMAKNMEPPSLQDEPNLACKASNGLPQYHQWSYPRPHWHLDELSDPKLTGLSPRLSPLLLLDRHSMPHPIWSRRVTCRTGELARRREPIATLFLRSAKVEKIYLGMERARSGICWGFRNWRNCRCDRSNSNLSNLVPQHRQFFVCVVVCQYSGCCWNIVHLCWVAWWRGIAGRRSHTIPCCYPVNP